MKRERYEENDYSRADSDNNVTLLNPKHLNECMDLLNNVLKGFWTKEQWQKELSDPQRLCIGIRKDEILLSVACGWVVLDELHITLVAVDRRFQGKGVGTITINKLLKEAKSRGCQRATLEVASTNNPAKGLYNKVGFKVAGSRKNYYKDGETAIIQWLELKTYKEGPNL